MIILPWKTRFWRVCVGASLSAALVMVAGCAQNPPSAGVARAAPLSDSSPNAAAGSSLGATAPAVATAPVAPDAVTGPRMMRGLYAFRANAGVFTDCASGQQFAVSPEADHLTLERAYGISRSFGESLLTSVEASVAMRPGGTVPPAPAASPGSASKQVLVVQRFVGLSSDTSCPVRRPTFALEATYWKLEKLEGRDLAAIARSAEPHLILQPGRKRVSGSSGCNRLTGSYALEANRLKFVGAAPASKTCRVGAAQERALLTNLGKVATWRITDRQLLLVDDKGTPVAQFSARAAR